jgi:two-component system, NarL family, invasion response regulator UvrY
VVRVLTVDDHAPFLRVAHELMLATSGFESVGEASSAEEGLAAVETARPDLVLADVHMPGMGGIEMARRIAQRWEGTVVVLISAHDPEQLPSAARTCGAAEVIRKQDLGPARLRELWRVHGPHAQN